MPPLVDKGRNRCFLHIFAPVGPTQECQQSADDVMKSMQLLTSQGAHVQRQQWTLVLVCGSWKLPLVKH